MSHATLSLKQLYSPIGDDLVQAERIFDAELATDLPFLRDLCDTVRSYRGKMLRPALLLLSGQASGGLTPEHHTLAAVMEMVHMATLVHDDVLDEAEQRRARPAIRALSGNVAAILVGDFFISHAFHLCSILDSQYASRRVGAATNTVCEGELLQNEYSGRADLCESDYFEMIRRKTGALTATACELGAAFSGADCAVVSALQSYGLSAGMAFQMVDDLLDIVGDESTVGKTLGRDLSGGKLTLPTIHCLAHANHATAGALRQVLRGEVAYDADLLRSWLGETDSVAYTLSEARSLVADALSRLSVLPPGDAKTSLTAMVEFVLQRRF